MCADKNKTNKENVRLPQESITCLRWINLVLKLHGKSITNLTNDLSDGSVFITLLECVTGKHLEQSNLRGNSHKEKIANILLIKQFLEQENVEIQNDIGECDSV